MLSHSLADLKHLLSFLHSDFANGKSPLLKILRDAETAASAAATQLVAFRDAVEDEFVVCLLKFAYRFKNGSRILETKANSLH